MSNKDDVFLKQMKGVSPIKKNNRIQKEEPKINHNSLKENNKKKQNNILLPPLKKTNINSEFNLEKVDIKKNIRKKNFYIDKKIDFHGNTLAESEVKFTNTILNCYNKNKRCLLFVTGKGLFNSKNIENAEQPKLYRGVIRSAFFKWVKLNKFSKYILSFEQASKEHGGDGAFYIYLRKKKN